MQISINKGKIHNHSNLLIHVSIAPLCMGHVNGPQIQAHVPFWVKCGEQLPKSFQKDKPIRTKGEICTHAGTVCVWEHRAPPFSLWLGTNIARAPILLKT